MESRSFWKGVGYTFLTLVLVVANTKQAMRNLGLDREATSEAKTKEIRDDSHLASQGSQLSDEIAEQVKLVGWKALGTLEAELETVQTERPCEVGGILALQGDRGGKKQATSAPRLRLQRRRSRRPRRATRSRPSSNGLPTPTGAVAEVGQMERRARLSRRPTWPTWLSLASAAGYQPNERLIKAEEVLYRAFTFELAAAFGPTAWLAFIAWLRGVGEAAAGIVRKVKTATKGRKETLPVAEVQAKVVVHAAMPPTTSIASLSTNSRSAWP